ncbi:quinone-dependent dihydroorotate dehydrogenase [Candidatus Berkiella aquae]|uniref:Dihydroorotate dehydrogenase (quinone) n=1 Tax=Candidatus Berkiella aquae TaxID=295108 RepID=A0A0Q9YPP4_9GAMM|nr:quinone-dependent dihydroorotate dehydrogenase [Candidatus Berkiella aquae]MCS5711849.1 quinone-dependent dihydroorotate dehydrogenase [Candidatus Berkiella aquae]
MLYKAVRPLLFACDAEVSHEVTLWTLKKLGQFGFFNHAKPLSQHPVTCFNLTFANPLGLAAGLDKNADCIPAWSAMGFGFVEVGTVTPKPQLGNPKPRLFRLANHSAIINRMGFNNKGVDYLVSRLQQMQATCPIGVNIGKNKDTELNNAWQDYVTCYQKVYPFADYVTVNISSPNTPELRKLQQGDLLKSILVPLKHEQRLLAEKYHKAVPILVKIAPDLTDDELFTLLDDLLALQIEGIIASNTTIERPAYLKSPQRDEVGGLSGEPLFERSTRMIQTIYQRVGESLPIVAAGGIMSSKQANAKLAAGAKLIQIYSGLIYQGPGLVKEIISQLPTN